MTETAKSDNLTGAIARAFERLDEHHGAIASATTDLAGVKKDLLTLVNTVAALASKIEQLSANLTQHAARQGPTLGEYLQGGVAILTIVALLAVGVGVYVSASYGGPLAQITTAQEQSRAENAGLKAALAQRDAEDRAELVALRRERDAALAARLSALEAEAGWAPAQVTRTP